MSNKYILATINKAMIFDTHKEAYDEYIRSGLDKVCGVYEVSEEGKIAGINIRNRIEGMLRTGPIETLMQDMAKKVWKFNKKISSRTEIKRSTPINEALFIKDIDAWVANIGDEDRDATFSFDIYHIRILQNATEKAITKKESMQYAFEVALKKSNGVREIEAVDYGVKLIINKDEKTDTVIDAKVVKDDTILAKVEVDPNIATSEKIAKKEITEKFNAALGIMQHVSGYGYDPKEIMPDIDSCKVRIGDSQEWIYANDVNPTPRSDMSPDANSGEDVKTQSKVGL